MTLKKYFTKTKFSSHKTLKVWV